MMKTGEKGKGKAKEDSESQQAVKSMTRTQTDHVKLATPAALVALPGQLHCHLPNAMHLQWDALVKLTEHPDSKLQMELFSPADALPAALTDVAEQMLCPDARLFANVAQLEAPDVADALLVQAATALALAAPEPTWVGASEENASCGGVLDEATKIAVLRAQLLEEDTPDKLFICECKREGESAGRSAAPSSRR